MLSSQSVLLLCHPCCCCVVLFDVAICSCCMSLFHPLPVLNDDSFCFSFIACKPWARVIDCCRFGGCDVQFHKKTLLKHWKCCTPENKCTKRFFFVYVAFIFWCSVFPMVLHRFQCLWCFLFPKTGQLSCIGHHLHRPWCMMSYDFGNRLAGVTHGLSMAQAWLKHGSSMAQARLKQGSSMAHARVSRYLGHRNATVRRALKRIAIWEIEMKTNTHTHRH